jgi:hypothetical protein
MVRKVIIAILTALAVAMLLLAVGSYCWPLHWDLSRAPDPSQVPETGPLLPGDLPWSVQRWVYLVLADGHASVTYASRDMGPSVSSLRSVRAARASQQPIEFLEASHSQFLWWLRRIELQAQWKAAYRRRVEDPVAPAVVDETYRQRAHAIRREGVRVLMRALAGEHFAFHYREAPEAELIVRFPLWLLVIVFGAYPCLALWRGPLRRRRRRKRNQCLHCGYNLTGLPEPRCPECGKPI